MKKTILCLIPIFLITCGCFFNNKKLTCTTQETYDDIDTKITIVTYFKKGKATSSSAKAVMTFESEEKAQAYYDSSEDDKTGMTVEGKNLIVVTEQEFEKEDEAKNRNETKIYFENSGYKCK